MEQGHPVGQKPALQRGRSGHCVVFVQTSPMVPGANTLGLPAAKPTPAGTWEDAFLGRVRKQHGGFPCELLQADTCPECGFDLPDLSSFASPSTYGV